MGKAHSHEFYFKGCLHQIGAMICQHCNQPVDGRLEDWGACQKNAKGDWSYKTFHRRCFPDQSGWVKQEKIHAQNLEKIQNLQRDLDVIMKKYNVDKGYVIDILSDDE